MGKEVKKGVKANGHKSAMISLSSIKKNPENPRQIRGEQFERLKRSIKEFPEMMALRPIVVDAKGIALGGNMRLEALKALGYKEIPGEWVKRADQLTPEQRREFVIKDNGQFGEYDWDLLANGWSDLPLAEWGVDLPEDWLEPKGGAEDDESAVAEMVDRAAELQKQWHTKSGQLWEIPSKNAHGQKHRLVIGDSTEKAIVGRLCAGKRATCAFTDPPWNVAIGQQSNPKWRMREGLQNDDLSAEDFTTFLSAFIGNLKEVLDGDLYCVLGSSEWPTLDAALRSHGFHWSATIIWAKHHFAIGRSKYHRRYEPIWYGWHKDGKSSFGEARDQDDVWEFPKPAASKEHPTMKPVGLVEKALTNSSRPGDVVVDLFGGSGTTMLAAEQSGRVAYLAEVEPKFGAVTLERMQAAGLSPQLVK